MTKQLNNEKKGNWIFNILTHLGLIILAALLFAASFPNVLFINGLPFLAWFAYIPILIIISKNGILTCAAWGAIYGFTAYGLFNYWLGSFHPLAGAIVYSIYLIYMAVVFALLKSAAVFFPKRAYLVQWVIWLAYEYLRTTGFLGYSYGITGYSQWRMIPLIQIAGITGVWSVSAIVAFPSFWLAGALNIEDILPRTNADKRGKMKKNQRANSYTNLRFNFALSAVKKINYFFLKEKIPAIIWAIVLAAALIFGFINMKDFSDYPSARIALIQHNTDPWAASKASNPQMVTEAYRKDLTALIRLSDEALSSEPKPQLVVWPETAFIPRIHWHSAYRENQNVWLVVRDLMEYLSKQNVPFLIGNDDAVSDSSINPDPSEKHRVDYNAALFFENGINTESYRKLHLVPFTEHFPYKKQFPVLHKWLEKADTHFWEKGSKETIFNVPDSGLVPGFSFASPICFEDSFGYLSRKFVRGGADVLVNITNDAWSNSLCAQYQHLTMSVFRAVENNRSMVRSSATGQTCSIDPNGRVTAMAAPFKEVRLNVTAPVLTKNTFYTLYGDYLGIFFSFTAVFLLLCGVLWCTIRQLRNKKGRGTS